MKKVLICCLACCSVSFSFAQRIPPSRLGKWQVSNKMACGCCPLRDASKIGIGYAAHAKLFGLKFRKVTGWTFGIPLRLTTDLDYRPRHRGNGYFNIELVREESIRLNNVSLHLNAVYKRVQQNRIEITNQFCFGSGFFERNYGITLAYALRQQHRWENFGRYDNGILLEYYREFFRQLEIKVSGIYWFDEFQYSLRLHENPFHSRFFVGLGYEKIGRWNEFDVSAAYIF